MKNTIRFFTFILLTVFCSFSVSALEVKTLKEARLQGQKCQKEKKYDEAVKYFEAGLLLAKTPFEKQQMLGYCGQTFARQKKHASAATKYLEASKVPGIAVDEKLFNTYYAAHYSALSKDYASAVKYFREATDIQGVRKYKKLQDTCAVRLCNHLYSMKKYDECIKEADKYLAQKKNHYLLTNLSNVKADCLVQKKDFAGAQKTVENVLAEKGLSFDIVLTSGRKLAGLYTREKKPEKAAQLLEKLIADKKELKNKNLLFIAMSDTVYYCLLAKQQDKAVSLAREYEKEITAEIYKRTIQLRILNVFVQKKNIQEAELWLGKVQKAITKAPPHQQYDYWSGKGKIQLLKKDPDGAIKAYLAVKDIPKINKNYISLALSMVADVYYTQKKDPAKAKEYILKAKAAGKWYNKSLEKRIDNMLAGKKK